jgi:oligopeptidase B
MPAPPRAPRRPTTLRHGGDERIDDWYWLRDRDDPAVLAYLTAENEFTKAGLAHTEKLQSRIFDEIKRRVRETDVSAPIAHGDWEYYARTVEGRDYAIHCRRPAGDGPTLPDADAPPGTAPGEQVILDENELAAAHDYFGLRGLAISPQHQLLAYSSDVDGGERATLRFRDLAAGGDLADEVPDTYYGLAWANDGRTIFYVRPDDAMRPYQVWRHVVATPITDDVLVLQEDDERFYASVRRARSGRVLIITVASKLTTEVHLVDADDPAGSPRRVAPREHGIEYHVEHHVDPDLGDRLFVHTNADGAENFKLMVCDANDSQRRSWREIVPHRPDVRLADVDVFARHVVLSERSQGLEQLRVLALDADEPRSDARIIEMPDDVYSVWVGSNPEFDSATLRYGYTSMVAPMTDVDHDLDAGTRRIVKVQAVEGYDADAFETHRVWATAPDGTRVPISLVHRRELQRDGSAPLLLYGYGSYEVSIDPTFSTARISLLTRGVVFAIAHVRGGGELGRPWYEDGKLDRKRNTFTDFIACAQHLVAEGYTAADRLVARGGSAGGLLMGAVANLAPQDFRAIVAEVPFVDCLTTMLDETLPLTITEWEEWGDPVHDPAMYDYIKGYAPYDNVTDQRHPTLLVTAGLNDPRVQYWEPAKWVARLRATVTDPLPLYLKTELGAGHHGPSGRYDAWEEEAFVLAFVLDQVGITD